MKHRLLGISILFLVVSSLVMPVHAQAGIDVTNDQATLSFPNSITFSADIQADTQIASVILEYGVEQLTCGEVVGKAFPDFTPGKDVSVQWTWDMRQSGSEPPGAAIWWQWRVTLQDGTETVSPQQTVTWLDDMHDWQVITGGNINLHWYRGDQSFGEELHSAAVSALDRLAQEVGIRPSQPIDLYIYANSQDMQDAILYEPSWTGGVAYAENSIVIIGISQNDMEWGKSTEAHELTHVLVGHLTFSCLGFLPNWLSEGLAMYGEGGLESIDQARLDDAIEYDTLMSVRSLSGGFSEEYDRASLAYAESYSIVNFLIEAYGQEKMSQLLAALRSGATGDAALQSIYGFDVDGLEDAWRESIGAAPRIQAANPTPLPTPTIVPTYVPVSGLGLAATPMPMPTARTMDVPTQTTGGSDTTVTSNRDWIGTLVVGLVCCILALIVVAVILFLFLHRKNGRNP
jgi:hypothetical protein